MKSDDLLVLVALGGLGYVLMSRMRPAAAPVATAPFYAGVPTAQAVQPGSPYNPATVAGWMGVVKQGLGLVESFGSFGGKDYVSGLDSAPALVNDSTSDHDSIWTGPDWL